MHSPVPSKTPRARQSTNGERPSTDRRRITPDTVWATGLTVVATGLARTSVTTGRTLEKSRVMGAPPSGTSVTPRRDVGRGLLGHSVRQIGDPVYRRTLLDAAHLATALDDAGLLVRAALANNRGLMTAAGVVDDDLVGVLRAACQVFGGTPSVQLPHLMAQLALELVAAGDYPDRRLIADGALALARQTGDPATLLRVLDLRFWTIWAPDTLEERLALTAEGLALAERVDDPLLLFFAADWRHTAASQTADHHEAQRALAIMSDVAARLGEGFVRWTMALGACLLPSTNDCRCFMRRRRSQGRRKGSACLLVGSRSRARRRSRCWPW